MFATSLLWAFCDNLAVALFRTNEKCWRQEKDASLCANWWLLAIQRLIPTLLLKAPVTTLMMELRASLLHHQTSYRLRQTHEQVQILKEAGKEKDSHRRRYAGLESTLDQRLHQAYLGLEVAQQ